jgi:hypothetical protein
MNTLHIATADGDVEIREDKLASVTDAELALMEISRDDLHRCFAEGVELMQGMTPSDRVRPLAYYTYGNGWRYRDSEPTVSAAGWVVVLCGYSAKTDPLMQGQTQGTA